MILTPHEVLIVFAAGGAFGVLCGLVIGYAWGLLAARPRHGKRGGRGSETWRRQESNLSLRSYRPPLPLGYDADPRTGHGSRRGS
jgi:hypothetical protein